MLRLPILLFALILPFGCSDNSRPASEVNGPKPIARQGPHLVLYASGLAEPTWYPIGQNSRLHSYNTVLSFPEDFAWSASEDMPAFVTRIEHVAEISRYQRGFRLFLGRSRVRGTAADAEPDLLTAIVYEWKNRWELVTAANFSAPNRYVLESLLPPPTKNERQVLFGGLSHRRTGNGYHRRLDVFLFNGTTLRRAEWVLGEERTDRALLAGSGTLPPVYEVADQLEHYLIIDDDTTTILRHVNMGFYEVPEEELNRESALVRDYLNDRRREKWDLLELGYGEELFGYNGNGPISRDSALALDRAFADSLQIRYLRSGNRRRSSTQSGYLQQSVLVYALGEEKRTGRLRAGIWDVGITSGLRDKKIREVRLQLRDSLRVDTFFVGSETSE